MRKFIDQWMWRLKTGWTFMRIFRLVLSLLLIVQAIVTGEWMFVLLGAFFLIQSVAGIGCCGPAGCEMPSPHRNELIK